MTSTADSSIPPSALVGRRVGGWLPRDQRVLQNWLAKRIAVVDQRTRQGVAEVYDPSVAALQTLIETNPAIYMGFHQMFEQVPTVPPYNNDPTGKPQVRDYKLMLSLINRIITTAPYFEDNDLVGFPINAILDWPMGTPAGYAMFTTDSVNAAIKGIFDVWVKFLTSADSRYVLTTDDNGWFGPQASAAIPNFTTTYVCDPSQPYYGFKSWDDFFTRLFIPGVRPVDFPQDNIITSACESTIYARASNVQERDSFWLKGQPYSLADMLNYDQTYVPQFVGGTIYQAFLSATKYHRWHSPVNGVIVDVQNIPGTYYAESLVMGFDPAGPDQSQSFITQMAARAIVYIQADNADIGLMCFMAVGMSEVSSCEVTVAKGQRVAKGDQIGMFHFGGSTHCLLFRPQTVVTFPSDQNIGDDVLLNAPIATVS